MTFKIYSGPMGQLFFSPIKIFPFNSDFRFFLGSWEIHQIFCLLDWWNFQCVWWHYFERRSWNEFFMSLRKPLTGEKVCINLWPLLTNVRLSGLELRLLTWRNLWITFDCNFLSFLSCVARDLWKIDLIVLAWVRTKGWRFGVKIKSEWSKNQCLSRISLSKCQGLSD